MRPLKINPQAVYAAHASAFALGTAMVCYADAEEVVRPIHLEQARMELVRAANALGCTVKADEGHLVLMQATEIKLIAAAQAWGDNVVVRAAEADSLRQKLEAALRVNGELQARINDLERDSDRGASFAGLEDRALWAKPEAA